MNSKQRIFFISQSIVVIFTLVIVLVANYFLISFFGFTQRDFIYIAAFLVAFGLILYLKLSKPLLEPLLKSDENLQKAVKETLHELNIPVSTILLNTKMLEKKLNDEKSLKRLKRIESASLNLLELYNDMEYSIKKEIDKIEKEEFDLVFLLNESISKFDDIKNDIKIHNNTPSLLLFTDKNGFKKVLNNLISNAIKYNKQDGFIKIALENNILSFYNTGKIIDSQKIFMIFDKYYQEDSSKDGFGLGLNIVKEFCDKNSITIKLKAQSDGTKVELDLSKLIKAAR